MDFEKRAVIKTLKLPLPQSVQRFEPRYDQRPQRLEGVIVPITVPPKSSLPLP